MVKTVSTYFSLGCLVVLAVGCVDAKGAYDEYGSRVTDANDTVVDGEVVSELPNPNGGHWLIAVRPNLPEDRIIRFDGTFNLTPVTANTGKIDISAQPLTVADATPVGDAFVATDADVASDASFTAPFAGTLPAAANPVSGSNAVVDAQLLAQLKSDDFLCGTVTGTAGPLPLDGTTWAAIRITDGDPLPTPIFRCEDQPAQ